MNAPPPRFITFEGGEGAGKSTQIRLLAERLRTHDRDPVLTREPGGSPAAESIRALLVSGETGRWAPMTETLLHYAARRQHLEDTVWPALQAGRWVLSDRYADSTRAYQGAGQGIAGDDIATLHRLAARDCQPDLTFILDLPPEAGMARASARAGAEDRYERMGLPFHRRLREAFLAIAAAEPERCVVIRAEQPVAVVAEAIWSALEQRAWL